MAVVCAACGKVSNDREFCDHCNADLQPVDDRLVPSRCPLPGGEMELNAKQRQALGRVEASVTLELGTGHWRVHWLPRAEQPTWRPLLEDRLSLDLEVLPACHTVDADRGMWIMCQAMPGSGRPWRDRANADDPLQHLHNLVADVASLAHTLGQLHRQGRVWLTFDAGAVEDIGPLSPRAEPDAAAMGLRLLRIANLDVRLFRAGECPATLGFNARYAAPEVSAFRAGEIGPATDVYHLAAFAYYWCAGLLPEGFAGAGLEAFDHRLPALRPYAPNLVEGVISVLVRGLAVEPRQRYATPREFAMALRERYDDAAARRRYARPVRWDAAALTITGRTKEAMGKDNEDHCLLRSYAEQSATLAAVADGISTCDIGSGALASLVASIILENRFEKGSSHRDFPGQITEACQEGSQRILEWALEKGYQEQLVLGLDLMGTTMTAAWLEGHEMSVGNLGDSRAYLISARWIDQLTVDGDLGTELLVQGAAPEQVFAMGMIGRALRGCVGGCTLNGGRVEVLPEATVPTVSRWPVVPGDVVVLCTDGLVEEGIFLEPEAVAEMVRRHRALPAAEIARRLVEAANASQRVPSATEPEGFGDNISCVVIKIEGDG